MIYSKNNFAVYYGCSKEANPPILQNILLAKDGSTVATNGHILLKVSPCTNFNYGLTTNIVGREAPADNELLDMAKAEKIMKAIPKKAIPRLCVANLIEVADGSKEGKHKELVTTDLDTITKIDVPKPESEFPEYEKYFEFGDEPVSRIGLRLEVLRSLVSFANAVTHDGENLVIEFTFVNNAPEHVIKFKMPEIKNEQVADGLIMPCKIHD